MKYLEKTAIGITLMASIWIITLVPQNPLNNLDDPSYWGVMGYFLVFLNIVALRLLEKPVWIERQILTLFLAGMPLIYIANWLRFDGEPVWILVEIIGLFFYGGLAWYSKQFKLLLATGIAGHGLWDLIHYHQQLFVPDWYIIACAIIDFSLGFYAFIRCYHLRS